MKMSVSQSERARSCQPLWLLTALMLLTFCSCRGAAWLGPTRQEADLPNARHLSNWDRLHQGKGPPAAAYTHQPRFVEIPRMPIPEGPAVSHEILQAAYNAPSLPDSAYTGSPYDPPLASAYPGGCQTCQSCRGGNGGAPDHRCGGAWSPPGLGCPWPADEYICDGGDRETSVDVLRDWSVRGLEMEDTVAHYDTLTGETVVEPSNRVCIYAPRFAAVRTVKGLNQTQQNENPLAARDREMPHQQNEATLVTTSTQQVQPLGKFGLKPVNIYEGRDVGVPLARVVVPAGLSDRMLPHEDFKLFVTGVFDIAEKARLANATENALAWTEKQGVQVVLDGKLPVEASNDVALEQVYRYDLLGKPRLRIVKTASKQNARPGEIVDFTLRFDNMGDQVIGNVTIIDNLTTRLEYVPDSVQASVAADFFTQENDGDSLILRWEVVEPLKVGKGGVIRFQARVR